jgi:hypothetical protein
VGQGRVAETDLMPRWVVGDTETVCSKLKRGNRFLKPNLGRGPSVNDTCVVSSLFNLDSHLVRAQHYRVFRMSAFEQRGRVSA